MKILRMKMKKIYLVDPSGLYVAFMGYITMLISMFLNSSHLIEIALWEGDSFTISASFIFDDLSVLFSGVVLVISGSVIIYSSWYMSSDQFFSRFIFLIYLFVGSMVMLIYSANLISLMLGWDGLGLVSFLLVCYYQNSKSLGAAMLTVLTNRLGDVFILVSIGLLSTWGDWLVYCRPSMSNDDVGVIGFLLVLGGMTKSAQAPFCAWLPEAMSAPTPVSSLVHSSTLVTAGAYLIIRCYSLCGSSLDNMFFLKMMSLLTLVIAGMGGVLETDFKKVVALSTLGQLSLMMFAVSIGLPHIAFFHLINHASFKALLFVSVGAIIHCNKGCQDMRALGMSWKMLPTSSACMVLSSLSLCGLPFLSGFYSKDLLIELSLTCGLDMWSYVVMLFGVSLTSFYSLRVITSALFSSNRVVIMDSDMRVEEPFNLVLSYCCLAMGAVLSGFYMELNMTTDLFFYDFIDFLVFSFIMVLPIIGFFMLRYSIGYDTINEPSHFATFVILMFNFSSLSTQPFCVVGFKCGYFLVRSMDQGWLEHLGPQGAFKYLGELSKSNQKIQSYYFVKLIWFVLMSMVVVLSSLSLLLVCW
uniref:NADH-ubiquinone oxidoreductase chain 5 n=2 Tax=Perumytilus purpuratus TaxID=390823 RepID=A0A346KL05_PERPP|nr:NADH dehydrogenase subunit 5 [Perumytilus purpuratus]